MAASKIKVRKQEVAEAPKPAAPAEAPSGDRLVRWIQTERRRFYVAAAVIAVIGGGIWFVKSAATRKERFASLALEQARAAADAGNLQLAVSDLARISSEYSGTTAGAEAAIMLARVRLQLGQADVAITELRAFTSQGSSAEFQFQANALLGTALEQTGQFADASSAYEAAASESRFSMVSHQLILDAARTANLAGDAARATRLYQSVISAEDDDPAAATEAKLRLAEVAHS